MVQEAFAAGEIGCRNGLAVLSAKFSADEPAANAFRG
jgi:hypothetical protein